MKDKEIILVPEFLERWSDKCNIPVCRMKEIYDDLKETFKDCVNEGKEVKLCNFIQLVPTQPQPKKFYDFYHHKNDVKQYGDTPLYKCRLSPYLKRPDNK